MRPERLAGLHGERRTLQYIQAKFTARRDDIYERFRGSRGDAERTKEVLDDVRAYNKDALRLCGAVPLIKSSSLWQAIAAKPNKASMAFGMAMGAD